MIGRMEGNFQNVWPWAAVKIIAATLLIGCVSGCATREIEAPIPTPREEPINSLALEQCIGENGPDKCASAGD